MRPSDEQKSPLRPGTLRAEAPFSGVLSRLQAGLTPQDLARLLDPLPSAQPQGPPGERPAAVLVALRPGALGLEVLLLKRAGHLDHHAGQIGLPGGRMDEEDAHPVATALREAEEEVRLESRHVRMLGALTALSVPVSRFHVLPVVGWLSGEAQVSVGSEESESCWFSPLADLLDCVRPVELRGRPAWEFPLPGARVWGLTALVLGDLLGRLDVLPLPEQELP